MHALFEVVGWLIGEILFDFMAFAFSAILGTPFILIGAVFDKGNYPASVAARYAALWN